MVRCVEGRAGRVQHPVVCLSGFTTALNLAWSRHLLASSGDTAWEAELGHLQAHLAGAGTQVP